MHPIERLRYVARAGRVDQAELVDEAAGALASLALDHAGLVTACRRLLGRHPAAGSLWALAARMLTATDSGAAARRFCREIEGDRTARHLADALPDDARVLVLGWPDVTTAGVVRRGDLEVLVVDVGGGAHPLLRRLAAAEIDAVDVLEAGLGAAAASCDVVVLEAAAAGPDGILALPGSRAAAAVARHAGGAVWAVVPAGRALPAVLWRAVVDRSLGDEPWEAEVDLVPADLIDQLAGPDGASAATDLAHRADCPAAPELAKEL